MQIFINTYGTYVHVKDEMFEIRVRAKKEQVPKTNHLAAQKVTSLVLSKGAAISTDALALALKYNVDVVVVENNGQPLGRFWHSKLGSTTKIRKCQLEASVNQIGLQWIQDWLSGKLQNQIDFLKDLKKHRRTQKEDIEQAIAAIEVLQQKVINVEASRVEDVAESLRGWEGSAGRHYFNILAQCVPKEFRFSGRSSRPAKNPYNAMLNYAYGILYSQVERALILAGLDPFLGFMHRDDYNTKSLVFDFIEPYRIHAERFVTGLFTRKKINKAYFDEITNGFSLNHEGKSFFVAPYLDYLTTDKIRYAGRNQTRMNALQLEAHRFANQLIEKP